jgi:O-antigen/teichoic acid export membrane protein
MTVGRNTGYNLVGYVVPLAVAVVSVPIYMHVIGPERFGILTICWGLLGYFGLFDLGLGRAVSYRLSVLKSGAAEASADAAWTATIVSAFLGIVGALVFWIAAAAFFGHGLKATPQLRAEILAALPLLIATVPTAIVSAVLLGCLQGRERFLHTNAVSVISSSLSQILPMLLALSASPRLPVVLWGAVGARVLGAAWLAWLCHREYWRGQKPKVRAAEAKQLFQFGTWTTLSGMLHPQLVDRLFIGGMIGAHAVAAYTVPYSMANRISVLPYALTTALFPRMSAVSAEERERMEISAVKILLALMTAPVLCGVLLAEPLLKLWLGSTYDPSSGEIGRLLLINFWASAFSIITYVRLQASGIPQAQTKILMVQMPLYILAVFLGIHFLGVIGCAWGVLAQQLTTYLQTSWVANRRLIVWRFLVLNLAMLLAADFLVHQFTMADWRLWALAGPLLAISGVSTWWNLPPDARDLARRYLPALNRKAA